jgi:hypothetical protein
MKPFRCEPGKKYPLVLYIHGGPHSAYNEGWFDEFQNLTGAACSCSTRTRAAQWLRRGVQDMIRNRWATKTHDLMKAVDICVARGRTWTANGSASRAAPTAGS